MVLFVIVYVCLNNLAEMSETYLIYAPAKLMAELLNIKFQKYNF